jgi:hypothetical protein
VKERERERKREGGREGGRVGGRESQKVCLCVRACVCDCICVSVCMYVFVCGVCRMYVSQTWRSNFLRSSSRVHCPYIECAGVLLLVALQSSELPRGRAAGGARSLLARHLPHC